MSFPRYPDYRDSGVEWLGEVPGHWQLAKLKHLARFAGGGTPSRDNPNFWGGSIPWVSPKDMKVARIETAEECITEEGLAGSSTGLIPPGRVLMVVRSGILKHTIPVAINAAEVALNQDMKALDFSAGACSAEFFFRWVQGLNDFLLLEWAKQGATVESIEHAYLAETLLPLPPAPEQAAIAAFLDRETAKIDALVAEQQNLIALLKEKRQALISHAVTKGLDPDVPMKDSGVAWLGEVPAHWLISPLKYLASSIKAGPFGSALTKDMYVASGYRVYGQEQVIPGDFTVGDYYISDGVFDELSQYAVAPGDLLISCVGTFGKIAIVPDDVEPGIINPRLIRLRVRSDVKAGFLCEVLRSQVVFEQFAVLSRGGTMDVINIGTLSNIYVPCPPFEEQQRILSFLADSLMEIDSLVAEADATIALLKERRTALISAAVTGKIDVRHLSVASTVPTPEPA